eukprot:2004951-Amphidinium_carterae.1
MTWMLWSLPEVSRFSLLASLAYTILYVFVHRHSHRRTKLAIVFTFGVLFVGIFQQPTTAACRNFRPKHVPGVCWRSKTRKHHSYEVVYNPTTPNRLFDCMRFALSRQTKSSHFRVRQLRRKVVSCWHASEQVLGKTLDQWAELEGLLPAQYLSSMSSNGWGGLPELQLLGEAFSGLLTVLDLRSGSTYVVGDVSSRPVPYVFGYTGCHYMVIQPGSTCSSTCVSSQSRNCSQRGGSPSGQRYAIFKKLQTLPDEPFVNAKQLLGCLHTTDPRCLNQVQGEPAQVREALSALIAQHNLVLDGGLWKIAPKPPVRQSELPPDPLYESDPWAKNTWDNKVKLLSQFFLPDGAALAQQELGLLQGDDAQ